MLQGVLMSKTDKDRPRKFRKPEEWTEYKRHGGLTARNFAGYGGLKCPCCGISNPDYKKVDRQQGKNDIKKQLKEHYDL